MDEDKLIHAARHGDIEAFNRLVVTYQDSAYTVAYRIIGEPDAAADATQEAFISAYYRLDQFQGERLKSCRCASSPTRADGCGAASGVPLIPDGLENVALSPTWT